MFERFTDRSKKVLEMSLREALQLGHNYIGTEHILLGLIREGEGVAAQVLRDDLHLNHHEVRAAVIQRLSGQASDESKMRAFLRERGVEVRVTLTREQLEGMAKALGWQAGQPVGGA